MTYCHTSTMLVLETQIDSKFYDDTPEGMLDALNEYKKEVEQMTGYSPRSSAWEYLELARIHAGRHGEENEVIEKGCEDLYVSKHSKIRNKPCLFWWKSNPSVIFKEDECCRG